MSRNAFALLAIEDDDTPAVPSSVAPAASNHRHVAPVAAASAPRRVSYGWSPTQAKQAEPEPFLSANNFPSLGFPSTKPKVAGAWGFSNPEARQRLVQPPLPHVNKTSPLPKRRYSEQRSRLAQLGGHVVEHAPAMVTYNEADEGSSESDSANGEDEWKVKW
jgi:hypothetical protein